jgi:type I restriction enzyme S subunit
VSRSKKSPQVERVVPNTLWPVVPLGEVVESMKNGIYRPSSSYSDNGLACLRMYNIDEGRIVWRDIKRMRLSEAEIRDYELLPGDLLVNRVNSRELVGKTAVIPEGLERCVFESKNIRVRVRRDKAEPKFVGFALLGAGRRHFDQNAQQVVGMASISQPQVASFKLPLPPIADQRQIVAEIEKQFTRLDAGVAALRRVQANLKRYRAAVLKAACEGRLVPTEAELARKEGRTFETGEQLLQRILADRRKSWTGRGRYKEPAGRDASDQSTLPLGWAWATVDGLCSLVTDGDHNPPKRHGTGLPHLTAKNVRNWMLDASGCTYISVTDAERVLKRYNPVAGDLIVTCVGTVGRTAIVPAGFKFSPDRNLAAIRLVEKGASTSYLNITLSSPRYQELIKSASGSTAQPHLYLGDLRVIPIPLPPLSEQKRIVAEVERRLSVIDELESVVTANLARATRLRQSVLQKAFQQVTN